MECDGAVGSHLFFSEQLSQLRAAGDHNERASESLNEQFLERNRNHTIRQNEEDRHTRLLEQEKLYQHDGDTRVKVPKGLVVLSVCLWSCQSSILYQSVHVAVPCYRLFVVHSTALLHRDDDETQQSEDTSWLLPSPCTHPSNSSQHRNQPREWERGREGEREGERRKGFKGREYVCTLYVICICTSSLNLSAMVPIFIAVPRECTHHGVQYSTMAMSMPPISFSKWCVEPLLTSMIEEEELKRIRRIDLLQ